jgi:hypothetical protein
MKSEPPEGTIADAQRIYKETGHIYAPLLESFYNEAMKSGKSFEISSPGYGDPKPKPQPNLSKRPFWKFW